jgi:gliding motility-associated-like protein
VARTCLYIFLFFIFSSKLFSKHIVGGEIIYDDLGANNYRITLKVYRDCGSGGPELDGTGNGVTAYITVYEGGGNLVGTYDIGAPVLNNIPPSINNPCIQPPSGICVEQGIYTYTLNLPKKQGGYYVVYQRCCRNNSILNLANPGNQGCTYYTKIHGTEDALVNSSPRYNLFPPIYLCANVPFTFDHSATDPDGDQLVYSLCAPFQGLDANCPSLGTQGCPTSAPAPGYPSVVYSGTYTGSNPITASPAFSIDAATGQLSGKPTLIGQFVVGVCIQEFRNGTLLNTHYRDFQFNVVSCIVNVLSDFADPIKKCQGSTITFSNQSFGNVGALTYLWDFGVAGINSDTSNVTNPTYTYADTGAYVVTLIANPGKPCCDTMQKTFWVYPELIGGFANQARQCLRGNSFDFNNTSTLVTTGTSFWDFGQFATPPTSTVRNPQNVVYSQAGLYHVKLTVQQFGCVDSIQDTVRIISRPHAKINNLPTLLCDPATVAFSNGSSSELPVRYNWVFSTGATSYSFEPTTVFSPPGVYGATLIVTTTQLCNDTSIAAVKNITVHPSPVANFSFTPQVTTIFDPDIKITNLASEDAVTWHYDFGDGDGGNLANCVHSYPVKGSYTITQIVTNSLGCPDTMEKVVKILPEYRFWIPNCFTPNGDKLNDIFKPVGTGWLDYEFYIFDKWGQMIFRTSDTEKGWDGRYKGKDCEQDVYVWKVLLTNEVTLKHEEFAGTVTLLHGEK